MEISTAIQDILTEIVNIGVGRASDSLSQLLVQTIDLTVPEVHFFNHEEMVAYLAERKNKYVNVVQKLHGGIEGKGILSFPLVNGKTLVDTLLDIQTSGEAEFGVVETEAIQEVGNIVINAVGSVISDMTGLHVEYEVPKILFLDYSVPVHEGGNINEAIYCFTTTLFTVQGLDIEGNINFIIAYRNVEDIEQILMQES